MDCKEMKRIFRMKPRSDDMARSVDQTKFEEWFISVAKDTTGWDGSYPVCMWQFDRDEIDMARHGWKANKSTNKHETLMSNWFERGDFPPIGSKVKIVEVDGLSISEFGMEFVGVECEVVSTFTRPPVTSDDAAKMVAVMANDGGCCCFRLEMVVPHLTDREIIIEIMSDSGVGSYAEIIADSIISAGFARSQK